MFDFIVISIVFIEIYIPEFFLYSGIGNSLTNILYIILQNIEIAKLIKHLTEERNLVVAKKADGIYHISIETFDIQIIVTQKLPPEENLYLRCLTNGLRDSTLINRLVDDYAQHQNQDIYIKYMNQLTIANMKAEGESPMVCEGILNLCGTSSAEIIAKTRKESEAQIRELSESVAQLNASNESLSSQVDYLKDLLKKNNISYE